MRTAKSPYDKLRLEVIELKRQLIELSINPESSESGRIKKSWVAVNTDNIVAEDEKIKIGNIFGRLIVVGFCRHIGRASAICRCLCGGETISTFINLAKGKSTSCGCSRTEKIVKFNTVHNQSGQAKTKEYRAWANMVSRCENEGSSYYMNYGGRGIVVCERWRNSFESFFQDMGVSPTSKHSIDRIDVNGDYEPENCRWATQKEQCRNRRSNRWINYNGTMVTISDLAKELKTSTSNLNRMLKGKNEQDVIKFYSKNIHK